MDPRLDLVTGINYSDTLALEADTQQMLGEFFASLPDTSRSMPEVPPITSGPLSNTGQNINIEISPEDQRMMLRAEADLKFQQAKKKFSTMPDSLIFDQKDTRRYINEDFGFNPLRDNEDFYAKQQGFFSELAKTIFFKLPTYTVAKLGQGVGFLAGMLDPRNWGEENYISAAADNGFAKIFSQLEDQAKNEWGPSFQKAAARDKGFFWRAFNDGTFWATDATDAAAFMASAFVPGALISKLGLGVKLAGGLGAARAAASSSKYLNAAQRLIANNTDKLLTTAINTASESMFEAAAMKQRIMDDLIAQGANAEEAEKIAGQKAWDSFKFNVAVLGLSNFWEASLFYKILGKSTPSSVRRDIVEGGIDKPFSLPQPTTAVGKFLKSNWGYYGKKAIQGIGVEGFYEENIQLAIERMNSHGDKNLLSQYLDQTLDAIKGDDVEASTSIGLGALIGGVFGTASSMANKDYTKDKVSSESLMVALNMARNNWISAGDIYKKNESGEWVLDNEKMASVSFQQFKNFIELSSADNIPNQHLANLVRKKATASYISSHVYSGTFDLFMKQLETIDQFNPDQLVALGFNPTENILDQKAEYISYAKRIKKIRDTLNEREVRSADQHLRREMLFESAAIREALVDEITRASVNIGQLSAALGSLALSDNLVERLNSLEQKARLYEGNKDGANDPKFYEKKAAQIRKEIEKIEKENEETVKKLKKNKEGFYNFENEDRNKSIQYGDYIKAVTDGASLSNSFEVINDKIDKINRGGEELKEMIEKERKETERIWEEANRKAEEQEKEAKRKEAADKKAAEATPGPLGANEPAPTEKPVEKTAADEATKGVETPKPTSTIPIRTAQEIRNDIPPTPYVEVNQYQDLSAQIRRSFEEGKMTKDEATELSNLLSSKEPVGTDLDGPDEMIKAIALAIYQKRSLTPDQLKVVTLYKDRIRAEIEKIKLLINPVSVDDIEKTDDNKPAENEPIDEEVEPNTKNELIPSNNFDPETNEILDEPLEANISLIAYESSLKTVTQEEDVINGTVVSDPYLQFKQGFLRRLLTDGGPDIGEFAAVIQKDMPDLPKDGRAQAYLDAGGAYGEVVVITNLDGERLYFNDNYEHITRTRWENISPDEQRLYKPLVYSFDQSAWDSQIAERIAIGAFRTGKTPAELDLQYQQEKAFNDLARQLAQSGFAVKVRLINVNPGGIRRVAQEAKAERLLEPFNYRLEVVGVEGMSNVAAGSKHVLVDGRYLVNGALYAVVQQAGEPAFYVRLIPDFIRNTELFEDIKGLINHEYDSEDDAQIARRYIKDTLFITPRRGYELGVIQKEINGKQKFVFIFNDKGALSDNLQHLNDFLEKSRFNVNSRSIDGQFTAHYIDDKGRLTARSINYNDLLIKNTVTHNRPVNENGKPKFRYLNTYVIFEQSDSNEELFSMINAAEDISEKPPIREEDATKSDTGQTIISEKIKIEKIELPEEPSEEPQRRPDELDEGLQAMATTEHRALVGEEEIQKVNQMFGHEVVANLSDIANAGVWGLWTTSGITLYKGAQQGTAYHEAWHHFSQMYLTRKDKRGLYDEVRTRAINFTHRDGRKLNTRTASDIDVEEFIADDFRDYVLSDGKSRLAERPRRNSIFRKILNFLKELFFGQRIDIGRLYEQLYQGKLGAYRPSIRNTMWHKLNAGVYNKEGVQIFDTAKASYYGGVIDAFLSEELLKSRGSIIDMDEDLEYAAKMYYRVRKRIHTDFYSPLYDKYSKEEAVDMEFLTDLQNLMKNWDDFVNYHKKASKLNFYIDDTIPDIRDIEENNNEETDPEELDVLDEVSEAAFEGKMFERSGNDTNSAMTAPEEIRGIVRMLPAMVWDETNKRYVTEVDHHGFPKLNEYSRTWNNLAFKLSGSLNYSEMYKRLQDPELQRIVPQAQDLLQRLPNPDTDPSGQDILTATRFYAAFSRDYVGIYSGTLNIDGRTFYFTEETKRTVSQIERGWNNNFLQHDDNSVYAANSHIVYDVDQGRYRLNNAVDFDFNFKDRRQVDYFLGLLGIKFTESGQHINFIRKQLPDKLARIQANINLRHRAGQVLYNPVLELKRDFGKGDEKVSGVGGQISLLSRLEALQSSENPSMSYMTAEGEMIYALQIRNFLSTSVNALNSPKSYGELISTAEMQHYNHENNPMIKYSHFFNLMYNLNNGDRRQVIVAGGQTRTIDILLGNYNGFKMRGENMDFAASNTSLNTRQKIIFDFNSLLTKGAIEIMRTETSASSFFFQLNTYTNKSVLPVSVPSFAGGFGDPDFLRIITKYLEGELDRMKNFADRTNVSQKVKDASNKFYMFRDILSDRSEGTKNPEWLKNKIKDELKTMSPSQVVEKNIEAIEKTIKSYFAREAVNFYNQMRFEENITEDDIDQRLFNENNGNMAQLVRAFIGNSFILNAEYILLFDGDLLYQVDYKDYFKRAKGDISTGRTPMTDNMFANFMRKRAKITMAGFLGVDHLNDYKTVRSVVIDDYETTSSYVDQGIMQQDLKAVNPNLTDEQIEKIVSKYRSINVADGQGHITLDFYRQFLRSIGNWNKQQEIAYQKEMRWFRLNYSSYNEDYTDKERQADEAFINRYKDVQSYFPPLKIQYNGPIKATGTFAKVLDKFSVAPFIPSEIVGTRWEQINIDMVKNGIGYSKFASGTKKYKHPSISMYKKDVDGNVISSGLDLTGYQPSIHFLQYLKEQINTSPKVKEESTFGSQIRKLIFANLFNEGVAPDKILEKYRRYLNMMRNIVKIERKKLYDELGLVEEITNNRLVTKVGDFQKFVRQLQTQADLRELNDNVKEYIQYDKTTGRFTNPLEMALNRGPIQDLIMGLIDRRIRRIKVNGDQLIQISSAGFEPNGFAYKAQTREEILRNGTNGLKFYTVEKDKDGKPIKTNPMEVKVGLNGGFEKLLELTHYDGRKIGTLTRLNELLKNPDWVKEHERSITIVGYRIPTQGPNSIEFMRIAEFLPSTAGSSIVLPAEIVTKAGSDYDIDKMYMFRPSFDNQGRLLNNEQLATSSKDYVTNEIISLFYDVLSDPSMFEQLITPNNTDLIKPAALKVTGALGKKSKKEIEKNLENLSLKGEPYSGTQILRYQSHLRTFESLLSAKKLLALFAVNNTFGQLLQQAGVSMNIGYAFGRRKTPSRIAHLMLFTPEERKQIIKDGRINLSKNKAVDGVYKQEYFSQLINGTVDAASDDFLGYLNLSYENADVLSLLLNQGAPFERALKFINQPILVEYYKRLRANAGKKSRVQIQAELLSDYGEKGLLDSETGRVNRRKITARIFGILGTAPADYHFSDEYLSRLVDKRQYEEIINKTPKARLAALHQSQKMLFVYFLSLKDQAGLFNDFRGKLNYDTTKFVTPLDVMASFKGEQTIQTHEEKGLFTLQDVKNVNTKSVIAPFYNKPIIYQIVSSVMPMGYDPAFLEFAADKLMTMYGKKNINRASRLMGNEWAEFIIKNFGVINGKPISMIHRELSKGKRSIARRLIEIKTKYPQLAERYLVFKRMRPNFPSKLEDKIDNIEVQRIFENTTSDQNRYIAEFRELANFDDKNYSVDQQLEIQKFFKDVALYAFLQSGFNRSNISFQEIVPQELVAPYFKDAYNFYMDNIAPNQELRNLAAKEFINLFSFRHAKLFNRWAKSPPTWRGVPYTIRHTPINNSLLKILPKPPRIIMENDRKQKRQESKESIVIPVEGRVVEPTTTAQLPPAPKQLAAPAEDRSAEIRDIFATNEVFTKRLKIKVPEHVRQNMIDAQIRIWDENIRENGDMRYLQIPLNLNQEQLDEFLEDIYEDVDKHEDKFKPLNLSTFEDMLKYYDQYGDNVLDDLGGESSLDSMIEGFLHVYLEESGGRAYYEYDSLTDLYSRFHLGQMGEDEADLAEQYLSKLKLDRFEDPNQLSLFDSKIRAEIKPELPSKTDEFAEAREKFKTAHHRIAMKFKDGTGGRRMRPEFAGKSTLQLIKEGHRTATSRDRNKLYNQQDIKVGDIIEFYDDERNTVTVRVTKAPYPISEVTAEQWSKLEGWGPELYEELKKKGGYEQFTYELVRQSAQPVAKAQGINISTKSDDVLGRALTNPTWGSKKDGVNYYDVETEYKKLQSKKTKPELGPEEALKYDMNLMYALQVKKLRQNPELIDMINARGGLAFIKASSHEVGVKGSRWEGKGMQSNFIKVLAAAYTTVAKGMNKFIDDQRLDIGGNCY